jgi:RHS repeat-associated protein
VVEENSYYAFGLQHKGYGATLTWLGNAHAEKYKYNGKELQDELGLNMYDYGARNYDPAIGRWMNVDPLAEDYEDYTPYQFASNQPVHAQEVEGLENDNDLNKRLQLREGRRIVSDATRVSSAVFKGFAASNSTNRYTTAYKGLHKGDTKAAIVDKSKGRIGADGKPTGKPVLRFDKADAKTKYAHINVEGVLDHAPIPGGNSSLKVISKLGDGVNAFNKVAVPVALTLDAVRIGDAINQDGGIGRNTVETTAKVGGSWAGAWGGSILGAEAGAIVGGFTGPFAEVASPVLGLIGGIAGGIGGAIGGEAAVEHTIENFGKSKPGMKLPGDL